MLLIFIFIATTSCEWVEISQTYHRPDTNSLKHKVNIDRLPETVKYRNQSLAPQWNRGTINKVENIGNVRRVPYASVKTPFVRPYEDFIETQAPEPYNYRHHTKNPEEGTTPSSIFEENKHHQSTRFRDKTKFKNSSLFENEEFNKDIFIMHNKDEDYTNIYSTTPNFLSGVSKIGKITPKVTESPKSGINQGVRRIYVEKLKKNPTENIVDVEITSSITTPVIIPHKHNIKPPVNIDSVHDNEQMLINNSQNKMNKTSENANLSENKDSENKNPKQENKMEGVWKVIKIVADTISKHSRRSLKGKLKYLEDLKKTIVHSIEDHVDRVWPDDSGRSARSAHDDHGHVEIPSSESALMTISFLTFAVFLIKLVLQVIHAYKQKTMMVTPAMVAAVGRATAALHRNHN